MNEPLALSVTVPWAGAASTTAVRTWPAGLDASLINRPLVAATVSVWSCNTEKASAVGGRRGAAKVNWSAATTGDVPYPKNTELPSVSVRIDPDWTRTSTVPAAWAGATATSCVSDSDRDRRRLDVAEQDVECPAAPQKFWPVMVTDVPPAVGPDVTLSPVTPRGQVDHLEVGRLDRLDLAMTRPCSTVSDGVPWK